MKKIDIHIHPKPESDPTLDDYVRIMDEHDVAAALVHATPADLWGEHPVPTDDAVLAACQRHPERLYGSCYIDLREAPERNIRKVECYAARGFKCVKMFPNLGFDPNDEMHEPVWEAIEAHGLACLPHCGYVAYGKKNWTNAAQFVNSVPLSLRGPCASSSRHQLHLCPLWRRGNLS